MSYAFLVSKVVRFIPLIFTYIQDPGKKSEAKTDFSLPNNYRINYL